MKKGILFILLTFFCLLTNGQDTTQQSIVILHDGSQIKGQILEHDRFKETKLRIIGGAVLSIPANSIKTIVYLNDERLYFENGESVKTKGVYKLISSGLLTSWAGDDRDYIQWGAHLIHFSAGYQFNQYLSVGGGIGLDVYSNSFIPVYADFRGYLWQKSVSPYYALQAGYSYSSDFFGSLGENISVKGGPMVHPALGVRFSTYRKSNILLEAGYKFQWDERKNEWNDQVDKIVFRRLAFKIGLLF